MSQIPENPTGKPVPSAPQAPYTQPGAPAAYGQQPGQYYGAPVVDPGKTMAIVSIILPFVGFSIVGLILAIIAKRKSTKAGFKNGLALGSIIVNAVVIVVSIIITIFAIVAFMNVLDLTNQAIEACQSGAETVTIAGQVFSCSSVNP